METIRNHILLWKDLKVVTGKEFVHPCPRRGMKPV